MTNSSSGKMGLALARAAHIRGAEVELITASVTESIPHYLKPKSAVSAEQMFEACSETFPEMDLIFMTAAVTDYTFIEKHEQKVKKDNIDLQINMIRTKDVLQEMGNNKSKNQILVGFAAESDEIERNAGNKLVKKNLDFIVANDIAVSGKDETKVILINQIASEYLTGSKFDVANQIIDIVFEKNIVNCNMEDNDEMSK